MKTRRIELDISRGFGSAASAQSISGSQFDFGKKAGSDIAAVELVHVDDKVIKRVLIEKQVDTTVEVRVVEPAGDPIKGSAGALDALRQRRDLHVRQHARHSSEDRWMRRSMPSWSNW